MPRVSVLMPTYDQAGFLARAVDSLLAQRLEDWELLILDDGSPDDTFAVVKTYLADPRITYDRLGTNAGLGAALNHALDRAKGELVAYLPSDDVYYADHLGALVEALDGAPRPSSPSRGSATTTTARRPERCPATRSSSCR